ncbi:hypothetical protein JCM8115_006663 [Rhodotorula mucilaginosa]
MSADQLRDELDRLLVDYLEAIELYQQARHRLESHLKSGFFDLARAKLALGPANVGPARYDLTEHASHKVVRITPNEAAKEQEDTTANAPSWRFALADRPDDEDAQEEATPVAAAAAADSDQLHPTLRHRARTTTSRSDTPPQQDTAVTNPAVASSPTEKQPPPRPSPLSQFAALPPPALRASATAFTQAVQIAVGIVDAEARVRECARRIKRVRKGIDRRREEEEEEAAAASAGESRN